MRCCNRGLMSYKKALLESVGEEQKGNQLWRRYGSAFPPRIVRVHGADCGARLSTPRANPQR